MKKRPSTPFDSFLAENREDRSEKLPSEIEDILFECYKSTKVFAKTMFPVRFKRNFSSIHDEIFSFLDDKSCQKKLILAPRGFGKSSIINLAYLAKNILFQTRKCIIPINKSVQMAMGQSNNLREELTNSKVIKGLFGSLKHSDDFSKEHWKTNTGISVYPRGSRQAIRGILEGDSRPDLIALDDIENDIEVLSPDMRLQTKEWFFGAVLPLVDIYDNDYEINIIGTILHDDSLLSNIAKNKDFETVRFELCDDEYKSNWPEYISDKQCKEMADAARAQGTIGVWYREYRNISVPDESKEFRSEFFHYYEESDIVQSMALHSFIIIDPAKTSSKTADDTAIVGISVDQYKHRIYIRDIVAGQLKPDETYRISVEMAKRIGAKNIGVEVTSLHEFIIQPFENYLSQQGYVYTLHELTAKGKKEDRIASVAPYYRQGAVFHNKGNCTKLESQLEAFPRGEHDDIADCLGYIPSMLDKLLIYFAHPIAQEDGDSKKWEIEQEYETLEEVGLDDDYCDFPGPLQREFI